MLIFIEQFNVRSYEYHESVNSIKSGFIFALFHLKDTQTIKN